MKWANVLFLLCMLCGAILCYCVDCRTSMEEKKKTKIYWFPDICVSWLYAIFIFIWWNWAEDGNKNRKKKIREPGWLMYYPLCYAILCCAVCNDDAIEAMLYIVICRALMDFCNFLTGLVAVDCKWNEIVFVYLPCAG